MKKIIYLLLTGAIFLSACSAKEDVATSKTHPIPEENPIVENEDVTTEETVTTTSIEEDTTTIVTTDYPEYTGEVDIMEADQYTVYEYFDVPQPLFIPFVVDITDLFRDPYTLDFGALGGFSFDIAEYLEVERQPLSEEYYGKYGNKNYLGMKNDTMEVTINLYTFFKEYDIPKEEIINLLTEYNNMNIGFTEKFNDTSYLEECFTDEEIEAIANLDKDALNELFVSDYCIIKDRSIYTPEWLYCHSLEDYVVAGISPDDVKSRISLYQELPYSVEGAEFFGEKLSEFTGETVIFNDWETKLAEN